MAGCTIANDISGMPKDYEIQDDHDAEMKLRRVRVSMSAIPLDIRVVNREVSQLDDVKFSDRRGERLKKESDCFFFRNKGGVPSQVKKRRVLPSNLFHRILEVYHKFC